MEPQQGVPIPRPSLIVAQERCLFEMRGGLGPARELRTGAAAAIKDVRLLRVLRRHALQVNESTFILSRLFTRARRFCMPDGNVGWRRGKVLRGTAVPGRPGAAQLVRRERGR